MAVAKAYGARKILAFDVEQSRVDFAVKHFADAGILCPIDKSEDPMSANEEFIKKALKDQDLDFGADVAVEVAGVEATLQMALSAARAGGTGKSFRIAATIVTQDVNHSMLVVQAGLQWTPPRVPMLLVVNKDLTIVGKSGSFKLLLSARTDQHRHMSIYSWLLCRRDRSD